MIDRSFEEDNTDYIKPSCTPFGIGRSTPDINGNELAANLGATTCTTDWGPNKSPILLSKPEISCYVIRCIKCL